MDMTLEEARAIRSIRSMCHNDVVTLIGLLQRQLEDARNRMERGETDTERTRAQGAARQQRIVLGIFEASEAVIKTHEAKRQQEIDAANGKPTTEY
jgi:hypothetical protein